MKPQNVISRRRLIQSGALLSALPAIGAAETIERTRAKVIVAGGHPGDPEYGCGGTIAHLAAAGGEVVLLYLNEGEPREQNPRQPKGTRVAEAKRVCEILGARPLFAGQIDGDAVVDRAHYDAFRKILEAEQPDAVFTHWPIDNHADHRAISMLVYDAWLHMKKAFALYYYEVSNGEDTVQFSPTHYIDIQTTERVKSDACRAHKSQSPDNFYALQDRVARWRGLESGHTRAEAFLKHAQSREFSLPSG